MNEHEETYPSHEPEDNRTRSYERRHCDQCGTDTIHKAEKIGDYWECTNDHDNPPPLKPMGELVVDHIEKQKTANDPVNHPSHYTSGGIEVIDAIEAWELGFHLANVVKYVARSGKKDPAKTKQDLEKARWYLDRAISRL